MWSIISYGKTLCCFQSLDCAQRVAQAIKDLYKYDCYVNQSVAGEQYAWSEEAVEGFIALLEFLA